MGHLGLLGLFLALVGGGVGLPLPEDLTLIAGGALATQHLVHFPALIAVGIAGVVTADWILYLIGRRYGSEMVKHPRLARLFGAARIDTVRDVVMARGARAVFLARFIFGTRIVTFLAAGTFGVPPVSFGIAELAGTLIFVPATATLGYLFADRAERLVHDMRRVEHWAILAGLIGLGLYLAMRAWASRVALMSGARPRGEAERETDRRSAPGRPS